MYESYEMNSAEVLSSITNSNRADRIEKLLFSLGVSRVDSRYEQLYKLCEESFSQLEYDIFNEISKEPRLPPKILVERWLPYKEPIRNIIFNKNNETVSAQKVNNLIVQWDSPNVNVQKKVTHLGVEIADPIRYTQEHLNEIIQPIELPIEIKNIKPPNGIILAADYHPVQPPPLSGDVNALSLIDLEKNGLSEYRETLNRFQMGQRSMSADGTEIKIAMEPREVEGDEFIDVLDHLNMVNRGYQFVPKITKSSSYNF